MSSPTSPAAGALPVRRPVVTGPALWALIAVVGVAVGASVGGALRPAAEARCAVTGSAPLMLDGCDLRQERLSRASLSGASMRGAVLDGVDLHGHDLTGARLDGASLIAADLSSVRLLGASMRGSNLRAAVMSDSCLRGSDLSRADLTAVVWDGVDLTGAELVSAIGLLGKVPGPGKSGSARCRDAPVKESARP